MSISKTEQTTFINPTLEPSPQEELLPLEKKVVSLMHKITCANKEIRNINGSINFDNQTANYFKILEKNHNKLTQYNNQLKEHQKKFVQSNNTRFEFQLSKYEIQAEKKDAIELRDELIFSERVYTISLHKIHPIGYALDPEFIARQERAEKLFQRAMSSKHIKDLYLEAMLTPHSQTKAIGSWLLLFKSDKEEYVGTGGLCYNKIRTIFLNIALSDDEALSAFVFELTNAISTDRHQLIEQASKGQISREDYAKQVEALEHEGALKHHLVISAAIEEMGWSESLDEYKHLPANFEADWENIKDSEHTEFYRRQWDLLQEDSSSEVDLSTGSTLSD